MSKKEKAPKPEKAPKAPKPPKAKKNFFDKAWDFLGAVGRKPWFRIAEIVFATLLAVLLIFYGAAMLFGEKSGFSIKIGDTDKDRAAISLSESKDFSNPTVMLNAGGIDSATNITADSLPENIEGEGGPCNGKNYLAYTFYLKNSGGEEADIRAELDITSVFRDVDKAIRIRLYKNGNYVTYASPRDDGEPEANATLFAEERKAFSVLEENVQPEEIIKYTFVVWLEGSDPQCTEDIKGGHVKMSLTFSLEEAET
ncbi:MAG: hypothetical protein IIX30_05870 [Clostridia bacterium]|nr:hypothetical protein [Clostridia bacterium]